MILKIKDNYFTSASNQSTNLSIQTFGSVLLSPDATWQFEHRPIKEQLQVCTKHGSYRCDFQEVLKLKQYL